MNEPPVIQTRGLTRFFGARCAVRHLDLDVPPGCVFAFLGRNEHCEAGIALPEKTATEIFEPLAAR